MQTRRSLGSKPQGSGAMPRRGMAHNSPNPHNRQSLNTARQKAISCCADSAHEVIYSIDYNHKSFQPITGQTQRQSSNDRFASVFRPGCNLQHQLLWARSCLAAAQHKHLFCGCLNVGCGHRRTAGAHLPPFQPSRLDFHLSASYALQHVFEFWRV